MLSSFQFGVLLVAGLLAVSSSDPIKRKKDVSNIDKRSDSGCEPFHVCFGNHECRGGTCVGINIGKCDCYACANGTICSNDRQCGGLEKACSRRTHRCNCEKALMKHGFSGSFDEMMRTCIDRYCVPNTLSCYGLPCYSGLCYC